MNSGSAKGRVCRTRSSERNLLEPGPTRVLALVNRQHCRGLDLRVLRRITNALLNEMSREKDYDLTLCLVTAAEITRLNETFLQHQGMTDVISFDYSESGKSQNLFGELFICVEQAVSQAPQYGTSWQSEVVRYIVHGLLHLCGFDDVTSNCRRKMKRAEDKVLRRLESRFDFKALGRRSSRFALSKGAC